MRTSTCVATCALLSVQLTPAWSAGQTLDDIVSKHIGEKSRTEDYNAGRAVVGTGPYKFVSYSPGDRTVFERSPSYYGPKPLWDKVNYRFINNGAARTAALTCRSPAARLAWPEHSSVAPLFTSCGR